jgi:CheY-like chemotaxis protein
MPLLRSLRILLVEDDDDSRATMARLLELDGHTVHSAACVAEALAWAQQAHHDLLLSDLGLPDGSGLDLMQKLATVDPNLRGVALSGYGMKDDVRASLAAGFTAHLVKPVNPRELALTIERVAPSQREDCLSRGRDPRARAPEGSGR